MLLLSGCFSTPFLKLLLLDPHGHARGVLFVVRLKDPWFVSAANRTINRIEAYITLFLVLLPTVYGCHMPYFLRCQRSQ